MSSFDAFLVVLVRDADGRERVLWKHHDRPEILDCWLEAGEMERVAREFCDAFEAAYVTGRRL